MTTAQTRLSTPRKQSGRRIDRAYLFMAIPAAALFTAFMVVPAVVAMFFSFTDYAGYGSWKFVGLRNYLGIFDDPAVLRGYRFTFGFAIVTVLLVNVIALALALGLNARIRFRTLLRTVFFVPLVLSAIVIAYVFNFLLSKTAPALFTTLGWNVTTSVLADPNWAWLAVVGVTAWQTIPGAMIIYIAGLQAVPEDLYEAARLDGAGRWRTFRSVTLPLISGYLLINTILGFKGYLSSYDIIVALTNGGPGEATQSVAMRIFTGMNAGDYAYQMSNAVIFFVITVVISLLQLRLPRRGMSI
ncbi:sugar ABC transporter permease [Saccharopolyspora sp. NPDC002686]|uniref:carbohydrate ABC transporter permease n=1 Tax=Saccharopolyspora sp. NPDC002686 TaxID=3154541 RepID=UPI003331CF39